MAAPAGLAGSSGEGAGTLGSLHCFCSNDCLRKGIRTEELMLTLPMTPCNNNNYNYNLLLQQPTASFRMCLDSIEAPSGTISALIVKSYPVLNKSRLPVKYLSVLQDEVVRALQEGLSYVQQLVHVDAVICL